MSTDIVRFQPDASGLIRTVFSPGALKLYLEISLPLTFLTLLTFWILYKQTSPARTASGADKARG